MRAYQNFLFDWDGTLANSSAVHEESFREIIAKNFPEKLPSFDYETFSGRTTREVFQTLGATPEQAAENTHLKQTRYRQKLSEGKMALLDGAEDLLAYLKDAGKELFLVTGGSRASVEIGMRTQNITPLFSGLITADDVPFGKPHPACFQLCLSRYALNAEDSLVMEDAQSGIEAAHAAGLTTVGLHTKSLKGVADFWFQDIPAFHAFLQDNSR